jgi:ubiquitin carboxyl-terminal hydrolase 16/45
MQNLLAMDKVRVYFLNLDRSVGPLTVSLKKLYVETNPSSGLKNVVNPKPFFGTLCTKSPQFRGFQQHDSHELLRCLLDNLSSEEQSEQKELNSNSCKENGASLDLGPTFVDKFFGGKLSSTVCCLKCGHSSVVHEAFLDLSLTVPTKKPPPKKIQPVLKGKKPKLPPKRTGRIRPKLEMQSTSTAEAENLASSSVKSSLLDSGGFEGNKLVESTLLGSQGIETKKLVENVEVKIETSTWLDFVDYGTVSNDDEIETKKLVVNDEVESETSPWLDVDYGSVSNDNDKSPQTENGSAIRDDSFETSEPACSSCANEKAEIETKKLVVNDEVESETSPCLDVDYGSVSNDNDKSPQTENGSAIRDDSFETSEPACSSCANEKTESPNELPVDVNGPGKLSVEIDDSSVTQDSFIQTPNNNNTPNIDSAYSSEEPVQAQDSEVILLPYKEEVKIESAVEQNTVGFDGFGDLFNEPDDVPVMGPAMRPGETSFTAGISSGSDPDEVDNSNSRVSVESCLADFTKLELLSKNEHAWHCEGCSKTAVIQRRRLKKKGEGDDDEDDDVGDSDDVKVKRDASKRLLIEKAPPILTVHLVRFTQDARGRLSKLKGHVTFKEVTDLRPYMDPRYTEKEKYEYRLVGVVEHTGSMKGGHYITYVRGCPKKKTVKTEKTDEDEQNKTGECPSVPSVWYHVSDTHVREASFEEVLNCEAYILFYEEI